MGFPYFGAIKSGCEEFNRGFPIPFVKKAIVSAINNPVIYLDGHNNPGFSGGPLVFWDYAEKRRKIMGVISGYYPHRIPGTDYPENSGIGIAYNIQYAKDLINTVYNITLD